VYDFLEYVLACYENSRPRLIQSMNHIFERELSAYRFISGHLTGITDSQELEMLKNALEDSKFSGVTAHLQRSFKQRVSS
jgi:hypothetical protein